MEKEKINKSDWFRWSPGWMFAQMVALLVHYGFKELPRWVKWFPTIVLVGFWAIVLIIAIVVLIISAVIDAL